MNSDLLYTYTTKQGTAINIFSNIQEHNTPDHGFATKQNKQTHIEVEADTRDSNSQTYIKSFAIKCHTTALSTKRKYIYTYMYTHRDIYVCMYVCMHACMYVRTYVRMCIYIYIYTHIYLSIYLSLSIYIYVYTYICICVYIYIYIYTYIHIYIYNIILPVTIPRVHKPIVKSVCQEALNQQMQ